MNTGRLSRAWLAIALAIGAATWIPTAFAQQPGQYGYGMGPGMGGYGPGYGMGPGMMGPGAQGGGYGPGYGPGMMGGGPQDRGYGMGPGMMGGYGPGYGMMGPGMMGGYGQGRGMMRGFGPGMMGGGMGFGMLQQLDLSPEQWEKVTLLHEEASKKQWDIAGRIREEGFKLRRLMAAEKRDRKALTAQFRKIQDLRLERFQARLDVRDKVEAVLTPEQRERARRRFAPWWGQHVE